jgi:hypothetical protein
MQRIIEAVDIVIQFLSNCLSNQTVKNYRSAYRHICAFCKSRELYDFSYREAEDFSNIQKDRLESGVICKIYLNLLTKSAFLLADCMQGNELKLEMRHCPKAQLGWCFADAACKFEAALSSSLAAGTVKTALSYILQFLFLLESSGIFGFTWLTAGHVKLSLKAWPEHI